MKHENVQSEANSGSSTQISNSSELRVPTSQELKHVPDSSKEIVGVVAQAKKDQPTSSDHIDSTAICSNAEFLKSEDVLLVGCSDDNKASKITSSHTDENAKESEPEVGVAGHPSTPSNSQKRQSRSKKHRDSGAHEAKVNVSSDDLSEENGAFKRKRQPLQEITTVGSEPSVETPEKKQKSFVGETEEEPTSAITPALDEVKATENVPSSSQQSNSQEIKAL